MEIEKVTSAVFHALDPLVADDVIHLCCEYGKHPFANTTLTIPNVVRCSKELKCSHVSGRAEKTHGLSSYSYDGIRNLYLRCQVPNTRVSLEGNGMSLFRITLTTPNQWVNFGNFTDYNILYCRAALFFSFELETSHPVDFQYETVKIVPSSDDFNFFGQVVFQELKNEDGTRSLPIFLQYVHGLCGYVTDNPSDWSYFHKHIRDSACIESPREHNFYRNEVDPTQSVASIKSHEFTDISNALTQALFNVSDEVLLTSPPIGSCQFPNAREEELRDIIWGVDPHASLRITPLSRPVFDASLKQKELERCAEKNAEYLSMLEFIRSQQNHSPIVSYQ